METEMKHMQCFSGFLSRWPRSMTLASAAIDCRGLSLWNGHSASTVLQGELATAGEAIFVSGRGGHWLHFGMNHWCVTAVTIVVPLLILAGWSSRSSKCIKSIQLDHKNWYNNTSWYIFQEKMCCRCVCSLLQSLTLTGQSSHDQTQGWSHVPMQLEFAWRAATMQRLEHVGTIWRLLLVYKYVIIYVYFKEVMQQEHLDGTHGTSLLLSFDIRFLDTWLQYTIVAISIRKIGLCIR